MWGWGGVAEACTTAVRSGVAEQPFPLGNEGGVVEGGVCCDLRCNWRSPLVLILFGAARGCLRVVSEVGPGSLFGDVPGECRRTFGEHCESCLLKACRKHSETIMKAFWQFFWGRNSRGRTWTLTRTHCPGCKFDPGLGRDLAHSNLT